MAASVRALVAGLPMPDATEARVGEAAFHEGLGRRRRYTRSGNKLRG